jgi:hypothetical protein
MKNKIRQLLADVVTREEAKAMNQRREWRDTSTDCIFCGAPIDLNRKAPDQIHATDCPIYLMRGHRDALTRYQDESTPAERKRSTR